jgi:hypothetical protein
MAARSDMFIRPPSSRRRMKMLFGNLISAPRAHSADNNEHKFDPFCTPANTTDQQKPLFSRFHARKTRPFCTPDWDP